MIKSMTGFGRGEYADAQHRFTVEIKSVNHRYQDLMIRMPKHLNSLEDKIRREISSALLRGRIEVFITQVNYEEKERTIQVNRKLAETYTHALEEVAQVMGTELKKDPYRIASYADVLLVEEQPEDAELLWEKLRAAVQNAVKNIVAMRSAEGEQIAKDLRMRTDKLREYIAEVEQNAPTIAEAYQKRLLAKIQDVLAEVKAEADETRVLQEAAIYADRVNITEELVRLQSHIKQFDKTLGSQEAIGRKLDFIVQEINRETNTIGSKVNDYTIANIVVELKSEIEKIREQIQNVE